MAAHADGASIFIGGGASPSPSHQHHRKKNSISEKMLERSTRVGGWLALVLFAGCLALIAYGTRGHRFLFDEGMRPFMLARVRDELPPQDTLAPHVSFMHEAWRLRRHSMHSIQDRGTWPYYQLALGLFEPVVECLDKDRLGGLGAYGAVVCGLSTMRTKRDCVVYIIADMPTRAIERGITEATDANCEVHTYDPSGSNAVAWEKESRKLVYHAGLPLSIGEEMRRQGHEALDFLLYHVVEEDYSLLQRDFIEEARAPPPVYAQVTVIVDDIYGVRPWRTFDFVNFMEGLDMYQYHAEVISSTTKVLSFVNVTLSLDQRQ